MSFISKFEEGFRRIIKDEKIYFGISMSFILSLLFTFTPIWQLSILAAILGGIFYSKMSKGALVSLIGVGSAWTLVVIIDLITSNVSELLNQISGIIIGSSSLGWLFILVVILIGLILGSLGGALGSGLKILLFEKKKENM